MKKTIGIVFCLVAVAAIALAIIPTTRDGIHWFWASYRDTTASYESYVKAWPEGRYAPEARALYEEHGWAEAEAANTVQGFNRYLQLHGEGKHVSEARDNIESLHWQEATTANTIKSYLSYAATYPQGRFSRQARTKTSALRTDEAPYDSALHAGTEDSLKEFLADFPGHKKGSEVQQAISDWQKATGLNTTKGYKAFLKKHKTYDFLAEEKVQRLMESANCRQQQERYYILKEVLSKELKEKLQNSYGDCIRADHFCEDCGEPAVGWCHMRDKYVCEEHRYFTQGGTRWRCP